MSENDRNPAHALADVVQYVSTHDVPNEQGQHLVEFVVIVAAVFGLTTLGAYLIGGC